MALVKADPKAAHGSLKIGDYYPSCALFCQSDRPLVMAQLAAAYLALIDSPACPKVDDCRRIAAAVWALYVDLYGDLRGEAVRTQAHTGGVGGCDSPGCVKEPTLEEAIGPAAADDEDSLAPIDANSD